MRPISQLIVSETLYSLDFRRNFVVLIPNNQGGKHFKGGSPVLSCANNNIDGRLVCLRQNRDQFNSASRALKRRQNLNGRSGTTNYGH